MSELKYQSGFGNDRSPALCTSQESSFVASSVRSARRRAELPLRIRQLASMPITICTYS
jgi:hypothetical protein